MNDGLFGGLFDLDHDNMMNAFESAVEFQFFDDAVLAAEDEDELAAAGLDLDDLRWMDEDERREAPEDAGLDPFDFEDAF